MNEVAPGILLLIVRKELRENLRWAVLGLLGMTAAFVRVLSSMSWLAANLFPYNNAFAENYWGITAVGSAIVGLLLGLAQILPESRGDKWGFLAHRPVHRSTTFFGKTIAGLLLYSAAAGIPLGGAMIWISLPGHLPFPFHAGMALPVVADFLSGVVYYFAGMLIGMRDARWYLSRTMGLGVGLVCTFAVAALSTFGWAVVFCAVGIVVSGIAARGAFVAGGKYETQPRAARIATTFAIGSGIGIVGVLIAMIVFRALPLPDQTNSSYELSPEGKVVKTLREGGLLLSVTDLSGQPLEQNGDAADRSNRFSSGVDSAQIRKFPQALNASSFTYRGTSQFFKPLSPGSRPTSWFYVHRERLISAYDVRTARLIGWLGPDGYSEGAALPSRRFDGELQVTDFGGYDTQQARLLAFPESVYRLDLSHFKIEKIYMATSGEQVLGASASGDPESAKSGKEVPFDLIATTQKIVVQKLDGSPMIITSPDPLANGRGELSVFRPLRAQGNPVFVWFSPMTQLPDQVTEFNSDGKAVAQLTLPLQSVKWPVNWFEVTAESLMMPITAQAGMEIIYREAVRGDGPFSKHYAKIRRIFWILSGLSALVCAVVAFFRTRTYAFRSRRSLVWTLVVFATGPFGLLTMLALLEWPAREACSACGRLRVVTSEQCEHCAHPFAAPSPDGTEIFETA